MNTIFTIRILYLLILKQVKHLSLYLTDKINFKRSDKYVAPSNLSIY